MEQDTLFAVADACEEVAQERIKGGAPRLRRADRTQLEWRSVDLEASLAADHPARAIWQLVNRLDLSGYLRASAPTRE